MGFALKSSQKLPCTITVTDAHGNPASLDGPATWGVSDDSLASVDVATDGLSATVVPKGPTGDVTVSVTGDGDLTSGVKTIVGTLDLSIVAADAVSISVVAGAAVDQ